ncbi:MAG: F0F1 ATP synthase subunit epsilon [Deltaproteobacteria bacterium]|nr:F0F1 ATP synthase subunit epsilon [Deltaproteobacteria bacterium]
MADELILEVVTPEKMAFSGKVEEVTVPGSEGEFGVLRGHAALLSAVDIGELNFTREGKKTYFAVNTGYAEVTSGKVTILVETAERSDLIDRERAKRAKENAEAKLSKMSKEDADFELIRAALLRAIARIHVAEKS